MKKYQKLFDAYVERIFNAGGLAQAVNIGYTMVDAAECQNVIHRFSEIADKKQKQERLVVLCFYDR